MSTVDATMTASNIRDVHAAFELLDDALQGRQPGVDQIGIVAWTEEPFRTAKQTRAMIVPPDAIAGRNACLTFSSSSHSADRNSNAPAMKAGLSSSANTSSCSALR